MSIKFGLKRKVTDNSYGKSCSVTYCTGSMSLAACFRLAKVPLCFLVGCTTLFGYFLATPVFSIQSLIAGGGVFFLAMGAATLNSVQEKSLDAQMERTKRRPLPQGTVSPFWAFVQAIFLLFTGLAFLSTVSTGSLVPFWVALGAVLLYNFVYTPLKRKSILAIIPGAISGAMPPYIGWLAGGGGVAGFGAGLLIALLILWQVPHYWLVLLNHKEDYQGGCLPHLLEYFQEAAIKRFFCTWIGALAIVMLMFKLITLNIGTIAFALAIANSLMLSLVFLLQLVVKQKSNYKLLFIVLNTSLLVHMVVFSGGLVLV